MADIITEVGAWLVAFGTTSTITGLIVLIVGMVMS